VLVQAGINMYFTAQRTLITHVTRPGERRSWFAFTGSLHLTCSVLEVAA
jgi:hypothetical protein